MNDIACIFNIFQAFLCTFDLLVIGRLSVFLCVLLWVPNEAGLALVG